MIENNSMRITVLFKNTLVKKKTRIIYSKTIFRRSKKE